MSSNCVRTQCYFWCFLAVYLLFKRWGFLGIPIDNAIGIVEVFAQIDVEDEGAVGGDTCLCYTLIA